MEVASIWAVNNPHPKSEYIIPSEPKHRHVTPMRNIISCNYSQGIHGVVDNGGGKFLITLQRKVASAVALNNKVSLLVVDNEY